MKAAEAMIAWTPNFDHEDGNATKGQVRVGPLQQEGDPDWTFGYSMTGGAAYTARRNMPEWQQIAMVFIDWQTLVYGYKIDPDVAHEAFLAIDEYRQRIAADLPGAEQ